jgi:hypothetical protein
VKQEGQEKGVEKISPSFVMTWPRVERGDSAYIVAGGITGSRCTPCAIGSLSLQFAPWSSWCEIKLGFNILGQVHVGNVFTWAFKLQVTGVKPRYWELEISCMPELRMEKNRTKEKEKKTHHWISWWMTPSRTGSFC